MSPKMTYPKLAAMSASLPDPIGPQDCTDENRQAVECYRELMALRAQGGPEFCSQCRRVVAPSLPAPPNERAK